MTRKKLFNWVYAILMLMPFVILICGFLMFVFNKSVVPIGNDYDNHFWDYLFDVNSGVASFLNNDSMLSITDSPLFSLFADIFLMITGTNYYGDGFSYFICFYLTYGTYVSVFYLLFEFMLFIVNWARSFLHRFINKD